MNKSSHVFLALTHLLAVETFIYVLSGNNAQWECRTSDSYMENRFRFKGVLMISVVCNIVFYSIHYGWGGGRLGVAWVLWCVLEEQRITWGNWFSVSTIWFLGLELSWSALETRTFTHWAISWNPHHPFSWGMVSCGSGWAQTSHVVENDTYSVIVCTHSSIDRAQTLTKVRGQLWEVSSLLLAWVTWVEPRTPGLQEALCTYWAVSLALRMTQKLSSDSPASTSPVWDYRCVPPHSVYVLLGSKPGPQPTGLYSKAKGSVFL